MSKHQKGRDNESQSLFGDDERLSRTRSEKQPGDNNDSKQEQIDFDNRRRETIADAQRRLADANKRIAPKISAAKKANVRTRLKNTEKDERNFPATIFLLIRISDRRRRDIDNMLATICDCLVKAGVVDDDNVQKVGGINTKVVFVEKGLEGFDLMIID